MNILIIKISAFVVIGLIIYFLLNKQIEFLAEPNLSKSLDKYYSTLSCNVTEGYSKQVNGEVKLLKNLVKNKSITSVLEIGFNGGHSAELFLKENPNIHVTSFDIGHHNYVKIGKEYIDVKYPNRHTLIIGNSLKTIPEYYKKNTNKKFDIIFIDGGHDYDTSFGDLKNCRSLAHKNTIVIMDDTIYRKDWKHNFNIGPTKAWLNGINQNIITEISHEDYSDGRGASWGKYIVN